MLSEADLDPFFDAVRREAFRLEALPSYAVLVESAGLAAYLAGDPYQKSEAGQAFNEYIRGQVEAGVTWRRVRVVRGPLSDYERWECEWGYTMSEQSGHHTFVLDLAETRDPPELPSYDWWMFDERVVLRFHYDEAGAFLGADLMEDRARWRNTSGTVMPHSRRLSRFRSTGLRIRNTGGRTGSVPGHDRHRP
jgi:hypothetical protein